MQFATLPCVGRRENNDDLEPEEAEKVRVALRELHRQCDENNAEVGRRLKDPASGRPMTGQAIGYILSGATSPSLTTARRLAALRGQTVFEFLGGGAGTEEVWPVGLRELVESGDHDFTPGEIRQMAGFRSERGIDMSPREWLTYGKRLRSMNRMTEEEHEPSTLNALETRIEASRPPTKKKARGT